MTVDTEHGITGDVLVHLDHSSLKDIGVHSVGHRLAILRAVYTLKLQQNIPIESGHYVPPCKSPSRDLLAVLPTYNSPSAFTAEDVELPNPNPPPQGLFNLLTERGQLPVLTECALTAHRADARVSWADDRIRNLEHEVQKLHETMSSLRGDSLRPASKVN